MNRKFISGIFLLLMFNLLIKPFWVLGVDRAVQNEVGTENYGLYFSLLNLSFLLNIILDCGITNFNNRNIAQYEHLIGKHFPVITTLKLTLGIIYAGITLTVGWFLGYEGLAFKLLGILTINQFLLSLLLFFRSNISGLQMFKTDAFLSVIDRLVMIAMCSWVLWFSSVKMDLTLFALIQTGSYLLAALIAFTMVLVKTKAFAIKWKTSFNLVILKQSFPFAFLILIMTAYYKLDGIMLNQMVDSSEAGLYARSYRLFDSVNMIAWMFSTLLLPLFSRMIVKNEDVTSIVKSTMALLIIPAGICGAYFFCYGSEILNVMYTETSEKDPNVLSMLMMTVLPVALTYLFGTYLTAHNKMKLLNQLAVCGLVINLALNYFLIPIYGAEGAAGATLATQLTIAFFQTRYGWLLMDVKGKYKILLPVVFTGLGFVLLVYLLHQFSTLNWMYVLLLIPILYFPLLFISGLFNKSELKSFLQKK